MTSKNLQQEKARLHPRNKNRVRYDLTALIASNPELADYVKPNKYGNESIDFANPMAVKLLNKALLNYYYGIEYWEIPEGYLCPPIPGRADYLHHMADLLCEHNFGTIPTGDMITCFDIGVGANCIYPIVGVVEYGWNFIGSDNDPTSIESARTIINSNPSLKGKVECKLQGDPKNIFQGILSKDDKIDVCICNPPFHSSIEEARKGSRRKIKNLSGKNLKRPKLNFAGKKSERIYDGGESKFIQTMIQESKRFSKNCYWFSTLVSKASHLKRIHMTLDDIGLSQVKTINMGTGNKSNRIVAWTFLSKEEQKEWRISRWKTK